MNASEYNTKKENADKNNGTKLAVGAGIGAAAATGVAPAVVAGLGFTAQGIAGGSFAAAMMAAEATAAGGGVAAGGLVATLQSAGVIGLGIGATGGVALVGAAIGLTATMAWQSLRSKGKSSVNPELFDRDILVRAARGEALEHTPVLLMRQAGRYMAVYRKCNGTDPIKARSKLASNTIEFFIENNPACAMAEIMMFSDILTPLRVLGIEFGEETGPIIATTVRTEADIAAFSRDFDFDAKLPFIREILGTLSKEAEEAKTSLIGFIGAPFTLAAYTIEGKSSKDCLATKKLMMADETGDNKCMTQFLDLLAQMIGEYACHQIDCGAQIIQVFESWGHQLSPKGFAQFAKPAAQKAIQIIKAKHPTVPVIFFANGGSSYLELQRDMGADSICIDWGVDMAEARKILGPNIPVSGNLDPTVLFGTKEQVEQAVRDCIDKAGGPGKHLLNLGHGVMQGTPEEAVGWLVDECKRYNGKTNKA